MPTRASYAESAWHTLQATATTGTLTWSAGDVIVALASEEGFGSNAPALPTAPAGFINTLTGTAAFTPLDAWNPASGSCASRSSYAIAQSAGSGTFSTTFPGSHECGMAVWAYSGASGVGAHVEQHTTALTAALTASGAGSSIVWLCADTAAGAVGSATPAPTTTDENTTGNWTILVADLTSGGSASYGKSGGGTVGPFSILAVEILAATAPAAVAPQRVAPQLFAFLPLRFPWFPAPPPIPAVAAATPVDATALTLNWDLRSQADAAAETLKWDLVAQVNAPAETLKWDLVAQVDSADRSLLWDLRSQADAAAETLKWDLIAQVNAAAETLKWDLRAAADASPETLKWDLRAQVDAAAETLKWDLIAQVNAAAETLIWDLAGTGVGPVNGTPLSLVWDTVAQVDAAAETLKWDLNGPAPVVVQGGYGTWDDVTHRVRLPSARLTLRAVAPVIRVVEPPPPPPPPRAPVPIPTPRVAPAPPPPEPVIVTVALAPARLTVSAMAPTIYLIEPRVQRAREELEVLVLLDLV